MEKKRIKAMTVAVIVNILIVGVMITVLSLYKLNIDEREMLRNHTLVTQSTESIADMTRLYFDQQNQVLLNRKYYLETTSENQLDAAISYLQYSNRYFTATFQIIDCETRVGSSISTEGAISSVSYESSYKQIQSACEQVLAGKVDDNVLNSTSTFTDPQNGMQSIGIFTDITLIDEGQEKSYLFLMAIPINTIMETGLPLPPYNNADGTIIDNNGNYIIKSSGFKGTNIYEFFRGFNSFSYIESDAFRETVLGNESGLITLYNARGTECLYSYHHIEGTADWYYFSAVPTSSFPVCRMNTVFVLVFVAFILLLVTIDGTMIYGLNKRLKKSLAVENEARIAAEQANVAKSVFLSRMSHEIRTPLNAVMGFNAIARESVAGISEEKNRLQIAEKVTDCLKKSDVASKHLLAVINDVLDMSSIDSGKFHLSKEEFDFKALLNSIQVMFFSLANSKGVHFDVVFLAPPEEWLIGDQIRVNQIITNLLSNAIKFTPKDGHVTLSVSQINETPENVDIEFVVKDTGIGMDESFLVNIWNPFEQENDSISRRFGGTGLGLSITKNLVDMMHGSIVVESKKGVGSVFTVRLSFAKSDHARQRANYDFSNQNILVVDDDECSRDYMSILLNRFHVPHQVVSSGKIALDAFASAVADNHPYTMCFMDLKMPEIDGIETIKALKPFVAPDFPFVLISAMNFEDIEIRAREIGVSLFLSKPVFQSMLFDLLLSRSNGSDIPKRDTFIHFAKARVLLVEDNDMNMEIADTILTNAGLIVEKAWNGKEALEIYLSAAPYTYKAILMDIQMPIMNGLDAARKIRASGHEDAVGIPIIAMTADAFAENIAESTAAGMNQHISKPIDVPTLLKVLRDSGIPEGKQ
ncbi:MAG TPA: response regulator [Bacillota bacterium]|nr:response regulator [Bacillota bacterium]